MRVLQFFAESLQALKIPLPPPVITQQPQAARLLVRIAVAEGSSLIVQRNGPVQIARDAAARLIAFRKAAQCLHVALLRCARIKLRGTRPVLLHTVPGKVQVSEGALGLCILLLRRQRIQLDRPGHVPFQSDAVLIAESQLILCRRKAEGGTVPKQLSRSPLILLCSLADHIAGNALLPT